MFACRLLWVISNGMLCVHLYHPTPFLRPGALVYCHHRHRPTSPVTRSCLLPWGTLAVQPSLLSPSVAVVMSVVQGLVPVWSIQGKCPLPPMAPAPLRRRVPPLRSLTLVSAVLQGPCLLLSKGVVGRPGGPLACARVMLRLLPLPSPARSAHPNALLMMGTTRPCSLRRG